MPKISVIIPVENAENKLKRCLDSVCGQSHKPDEIILWLGDEEFPNREKDIPEAVLKLKDCGISIKFTKIHAVTRNLFQP